jgi:hypothetical protein
MVGECARDSKNHLTSCPCSPFSLQRRVDISKLSGVGISHNWGGFMTAAQVRAC